MDAVRVQNQGGVIIICVRLLELLMPGIMCYKGWLIVMWFSAVPS